MTSYVLEDGDGHMTVVEQQSHTIPGVMAESVQSTAFQRVQLQ
jgi:hypothetical protein